MVFRDKQCSLVIEHRMDEKGFPYLFKHEITNGAYEIFDDPDAHACLE
jgi:hypothetical protein